MRSENKSRGIKNDLPLSKRDMHSGIASKQSSNFYLIELKHVNSNFSPPLSNIKKERMKAISKDIQKSLYMYHKKIFSPCEKDLCKTSIMNQKIVHIKFLEIKIIKNFSPFDKELMDKALIKDS